MKLKKEKKGWKFYGLIGLVLILMIGLMFISFLQGKKETPKRELQTEETTGVEEGQVQKQESETEMQEETKTQSESPWDVINALPKVDPENDVSHVAGAKNITIHDQDVYMKPVMQLYSFRANERVLTYTKRYVPDATEATCLNAGASEQNVRYTNFYLELNDPDQTLLVVEWNPDIRDVSVRECIEYTKEDILNEVWNRDGGPEVRDVP